MTSPTVPTASTPPRNPSEPTILDSPSQRDDFDEGMEICVYDIVYKSGTIEEHLGYVGEHITFSSFDKDSEGQSGAQSFVEYKAFLEYGNYCGTFSCETTDNESTFTNFKLLSLNEYMKRDFEDLEPMEFEFSSAVDDAGMPFLAWYMDCGWVGGGQCYLSGWAKMRDIDDTKLTRAERKRLSEVDNLGVELPYDEADEVDEESDEGDEESDEGDEEADEEDEEADEVDEADHPGGAT
ncbi:hypothetical protein B7494_g3517 [Chlorociboria aeruginascens]|nr:hypothetical protein B7494_g3517 [Chlorociboria aeruginascens]